MVHRVVAFQYVGMEISGGPGQYVSWTNIFRHTYLSISDSVTNI